MSLRDVIQNKGGFDKWSRPYLYFLSRIHPSGRSALLPEQWQNRERNLNIIKLYFDLKGNCAAVGKIYGLRGWTIRTIIVEWLNWVDPPSYLLDHMEFKTTISHNGGTHRN